MIKPSSTKKLHVLSNVYGARGAQGLSNAATLTNSTINNNTSLSKSNKTLLIKSTSSSGQNSISSKKTSPVIAKKHNYLSHSDKNSGRTTPVPIANGRPSTKGTYLSSLKKPLYSKAATVNKVPVKRA